MAYTPDPTDITRPTDNDPAESAQAEFRALKGFIKTFVASGNVWNRDDHHDSIGLSGGQLVATKSVADLTGRSVRATVGKKAGKWYWEIYWLNQNLLNPGFLHIGIATLSPFMDAIVGSTALGWSYRSDGQKYNAGAAAAYGALFNSADVIGIALDCDAGTLTFYKNNVSQGVAYNAGLAGVMVFPTVSLQAINDQVQANFGSYVSIYTPPIGYNTFAAASTLISGNNRFAWDNFGGF